MGAQTGLRESLFNYLGKVLPSSASQLVSTTMLEVSAPSGGGKIAFGILAALWAASNGMGAITEALNIAYDVKESRPWWRQRLTAIGLNHRAFSTDHLRPRRSCFTADTSRNMSPPTYGFGSVFTTRWKILQWPIVLAFVLLSFALIYYFAPDVHDQKWVWVTPGAVLGVASVAARLV